MSTGHAYESLLKKYQIQGLPENGRMLWERYVSDRPAVNFKLLHPTFFQIQSDVLAFPTHCVHELLRVNDLIDADQDLKGIALFYRHLIFGTSNPWEINDSIQPIIPLAMKEAGHAFILVVLLSQLQLALHSAKSKGIPSSVLAATLKTIEQEVDQYYKQTGHWGIGHLEWISKFFSLSIFRLGRLLFTPEALPVHMKVYRNIETEAVIALSGSGTKVRRDGYIAKRIEPEATDILFKETKNGFICHRISPEGMISMERTYFAKNQWKMVLQSDDTMLAVHIPDGPGYTPNGFISSMREASTFFERFFPDLEWKGFWCWSWLFDPRLQQIMQGYGNIVKVQKHVYLCPVEPSDEDIFRDIFKNGVPTPSGGEGMTTLQRRMVSHLSRGGEFTGGGMFYLKEDLKEWERCPYRS